MKHRLLSLLAGVLAFAIALPVVAANITVVGMSPRASAATTFGLAYNDAIGSNFYHSADCKDAFRKYNKTENAVMIYNSSMEFAARNKGLDCLIENVADKKVLFVGMTYMQICKLPGTEYSLGVNQHTLGMASMYAVKKHEDQFSDGGANVKIIPFSGAKTALASLYAGDINLAWLSDGLAAKQGNKIECIASTNPASSNYLGSKVNLVVPDFRITYVVYTNSKDEKIITELKAGGQSESFNQFLTNSHTTGTWEITDESVSGVVKYVERMVDAWANNQEKK